MSSAATQEVLPPLRRRRRRNKWNWAVVLFIAVILAFTAWAVAQAMNSRKKALVEDLAAPVESKKPEEKPKTTPTLVVTNMKPAPTSLADLPPARLTASAPAPIQAPTAADMAAKEAIKAAATELQGEIKKKSTAAKEAVAEATAKDIGLRSEVKNDFLVVSRMMQDFILARSEAEIEQIILRPLEVMPKYREWTARIKLQPSAEQMASAKFMTTEHRMIMAVPLMNGSKRLAVFEKIGKAKFRLDWESFAGWCERRFEDVAKLESNRQVLMRVNAQRTAVKPPFPVKDGGMSFTLTHPDEPMTLNAHMSADALAEGGTAVRYMAAMKKSGTVTLKIFVDDECRSHGWVKIAAVPNVGWVSGLDTTGGSTILPK